jgi:glucose/arabinose dehydrogenase
MRKLVLTISLAAWLASSVQPAAAQQLVQFPGTGPSFNFASPFYVAGEPADPSRIYVVEGAGRIRLVINGATQETAFLDISGDVCSSADGCGSESGLFSMALAPDYASSGLFYVFYTRDAVQQHDLVIREFRRTTDPNNIDETTGRDVLVIPHPGAANHNGGQLQFGPDGLLYISTGDGGNGQSANGQSTTVLLGKILRIDPAGTNPGEYSIPADNPFAGATAGADEIYSYGLRNPYRFSFDRLTGDLTIGDVGAGTREEVDFVLNGGGRGANFGWSCFEGSQPTGQCGALPPNHTPPVLDYTRAGSSAAVNGGYVVRDGTLPSLLGRYLYADTFDALSDQIHSAQLFPGGNSGNAPTGLTASFVVSFGEDACGHVYVAHGNNTVSRIQPFAGAPACQPQTVLPPPDAGGGAAGLVLNVDLRKARRGAARREVTVIVSCDSACSAHGEGRISLRGKDIGLDPDDASLPLRVPGALDLGLSGKGARRLRGTLAEGGRAVAKIEVSATGGGGGTATVKRKVRQRR